MRSDNRAPNQLRETTITPHFLPHAEGSVLIEYRGGQRIGGLLFAVLVLIAITSLGNGKALFSADNGVTNGRGHITGKKEMPANITQKLAEREVAAAVAAEHPHHVSVCCGTEEHQER